MLTTECTRQIAEKLKVAESKGFAWNPVYVDVVTRDGEKLGHIVSDGYKNVLWNFYAVDKKRRDVIGKLLTEVVPKWCGNWALTNIRDFDEITESERQADRDAGATFIIRYTPEENDRWVRMMSTKRFWEPRRFESKEAAEKFIDNLKKIGVPSWVRFQVLLDLS